MDFIERYVTLIRGEGENSELKGFTDAPPSFVRGTAIYVLSTLCGRNYQIMNLTDTDIWNRDPSSISGTILVVWYILIGKSRVSRKTTTVNFALKYLRKICDSILLQYDFTPEKLIEGLSDMNQGSNMTHATWINDEISSFFKSLNKKDYMSTLNGILSKIYDGDTYSRGTITRGEEVIQNPYLTTLVASTEFLPTLFSENMIRQGFLNRFIYITGVRESWSKKRRNMTAAEEQEVGRLLDWGEALYNKNGTRTMTMSKDAREKYNSFTRDMEQEIMNRDLGIHEGYRGQIPNFVERISGINRIARMPISEIGIDTTMPLQIEVKDVKKAIDYSEMVWEHFKNVVDLMRTSAVSRKVMTDENLKSLVYGIIGRENPIQRSDLLIKSGLTADRLDRIVHTLRQEDRIEQETIQDGGAGKPKTMYYQMNGE